MVTGFLEKCDAFWIGGWRTSYRLDITAFFTCSNKVHWWKCFLNEEWNCWSCFRWKSHSKNPNKKAKLFYFFFLWYSNSRQVLKNTKYYTRKMCNPACSSTVLDPHDLLWSGSMWSAAGTAQCDCRICSRCQWQPPVFCVLPYETLMACWQGLSCLCWVFFLHSLSHCKSSPLILNPLHLNYSYSMNNSILIQHLAKCVCVCSLFERQPPLYLLVPFRCHLKKNKAKKAGREKGSICFLFFKLRIFFIISDKFD